jgi:hypothetical protein
MSEKNDKRSEKLSPTGVATGWLAFHLDSPCETTFEFKLNQTKSK